MTNFLIIVQVSLLLFSGTDDGEAKIDAVRKAMGLDQVAATATVVQLESEVTVLGESFGSSDAVISTFDLTRPRSLSTTDSTRTAFDGQLVWTNSESVRKETLALEWAREPLVFLTNSQFRFTAKDSITLLKKPYAILTVRHEGLDLVIGDLWIDETTGLPYKLVGPDTQRGETFYRKFQEMGGVRYPSQITMGFDNLLVKVTVSRLRLLDNFDARQFSLPQ